MASLGSHTFEVKKLANGATMHVTIGGFQQWRWRLWVSKQLFRLACWISWMNCEIIDQDTEGD
jgi:hypothetical protein